MLNALLNLEPEAQIVIIALILLALVFRKEILQFATGFCLTIIGLVALPVIVVLGVIWFLYLIYEVVGGFFVFTCMVVILMNLLGAPFGAFMIVGLLLGVVGSIIDDVKSKRKKLQ